MPQKEPFLSTSATRRGALALAAASGGVAAAWNNTSAQGCSESVCIYPLYPDDIHRPKEDEILKQPQHTYIDPVTGETRLVPFYIEMTKLQANKVYDLRDLQILPNGTALTYKSTILEAKLLPSPESLSLPLERVGGREVVINNSHGTPLTFTAPEGSHVVYVEKWDKKGMEAPTRSTSWLWLPEGATITNTKTGVSKEVVGSFALPVGYEDRDKMGNTTSSTELAQISFSVTA